MNLLRFFLYISFCVCFSPKISSKEFSEISDEILYFDDSSTILNLNQEKLYKSDDNGVNWKDITSEFGLDARVKRIAHDKYFENRAFIVLYGKTHYFTSNKGQSWKSFSLGQEVTSKIDVIIKENQNAKQNVLVDILECLSMFSCVPHYYYTNDEFSTTHKIESIKDLVFCSFTGTTTNEKTNDILCVSSVKDDHGRLKYLELYVTKDFFKTQLTIANSELAQALIYDVEIVRSFVVIKAFSDRYNDQSTVNLFVSKDGENFKKALFPGDLKNEQFVMLPSSDNGLYVSVWGSKKRISSHLSTVVSELYVSDSDGFTFKKLDKLNQNSEFYGFNLVEKISNLAGVWLGNIMLGLDGVFSLFPNVVSMMSFDDGRSWNYLDYDLGDSNLKMHCKKKEQCHLNMVDAIEMKGDGSFASGPAPGIILGIGAVSDSLLYSLDSLSTWISRDGGYTWTVALEEACAFSMGDQGNIIVAVPFFKEGSNNDAYFYFSVDQGKTWTKQDLHKKLKPSILITTVDGSSQKFIYSASEYEKKKYQIYSLDFSNAFNGKVCGSSDMEKFVARKNEKDAICLMGHKEYFNRRKQDAQCFVNKLYQDVEPSFEACDCTTLDYECSPGFAPDLDGECQPELKYFRALCAGLGDVKKTVKVTTKIPGNTCRNELDSKTYELDCAAIRKSSASQDIRTHQYDFKGRISQYVFLDQSLDQLKDETLLVRTQNNRLFISHNGGLDFFWASINDNSAIGIIENRFYSDYVVVLTPKNVLYLSDNRAQSFKEIELPSPINGFGYVPVVFHPHDPATWLFVGSENCDDGSFSANCKTVAYITKDLGKSFQKLLTDVRSCDFSGAKFGTNEDLIICEQKNADHNMRIVSSTNLFKDTTVAFEATVGMAPNQGFLVVAEIENGGESLKSFSTVDGVVWAHAKFPHDFSVKSEQAYTVMRSNSKSIYLHVTTSVERGREYGSILKSNSNGTSYVDTEDYVNRDVTGFVDFEHIDGLEGVSLINVVSNVDAVNKGENKLLKSKITHNDAGEWAYITPPLVNSKGEKYSCSGKSLEECSLNIHGFTERSDYRDTFSSGSAVGVLFGIGNVGPHLLPKLECSTFLTIDAGITWREVNSRPLNWEYGDQGSILVLVDQFNPSKTLFYSLDHGASWSEYEFTSEDVQVADIATIPSDTSRRFVVFAEKDGDAYGYGIDFTGIYSRQCKFDLDNIQAGDFEYWSPKHPFLADNCLFGHEAQYLRRIGSHSDCFVGNAPLSEAYKVLRNCSCSRRDYECDYNFARAMDGTCKLVQGLKPKDPKEVCLKEGSFEYFEPTGYRRIPLTTCVDGIQLDHWEVKPCPGKEDKFNRKHGTGLSGFNLLLVVLVPAAAFAFASWFVYEKGIRRNGGFARFGQIRLDDEDFTRVENNATDKIVNRIVDVGVMAFMGSIALVRFLIKARKALHERLSGRRSVGRYTSIGSTSAFLDEEEDILGSDDEEDDRFIDDQFDDDARSVQVP